MSVQAADLFLLKRVGQGAPLTLLVNDSGMISCNGKPKKPLSDPLLLQARTLASDLGNDAKAKLRLAPGPHSVAFYTVALQNGTVSFPDTAAAAHHELAEAELFTVQAAQSACGLSG